jgi:signal peptidase I
MFSFLFGLVTSQAMLVDNVQLPRSPLQFTGGAERASPQDWISQSDILVYNDRVEINLEGAKWATFADTNSMDPFLDEGANAIQVTPKRPEDLAIGDIITYDYNGRKIIHRIVDIQQDSLGYKFTVKGDNNAAPDPVDVRFEDIERVLVAIIY